MFVIENYEIYEQEANELLSNYSVVLDIYHLHYNKKAAVVRGQDVALCEAAFQMNFHQENKLLCPVCVREIERTGVGSDVCGHLIFTSPIKGGFFDEE